jgi:hypothetical protein
VCNFSSKQCLRCSKGRCYQESRQAAGKRVHGSMRFELLQTFAVLQHHMLRHAKARCSSAAAAALHQQQAAHAQTCVARVCAAAGPQWLPVLLLPLPCGRCPTTSTPMTRSWTRTCAAATRCCASTRACRSAHGTHGSTCTSGCVRAALICRRYVIVLGSKAHSRRSQHAVQQH